MTFGFGAANAWGKLPYTLYAAGFTDSHSMLEHNPSADGRTYRYAADDADVLRPFGFGAPQLP